MPSHSSREVRRSKNLVKKHSEFTQMEKSEITEERQLKDHEMKHSETIMFPTESSVEKSRQEHVVREAAAPTNVGCGSRATRRRRELRRRRRLGATEATP